MNKTIRVEVEQYVDYDLSESDVIEFLDNCSVKEIDRIISQVVKNKKISLGEIQPQNLIDEMKIKLLVEIYNAKTLDQIEAYLK